MVSASQQFTMPADPHLLALALPTANRQHLPHMPFARILRSSALMGGAAGVSLIAALIRNKLIAMLLGPAGLGVFGILSQYAGMMSQIFGLGAGSTAVRHIADVDEEHRLQRESEVRSFTWKVSAIGAIGAAALALPVCYWSLDGPENLHLMAIAGLAAPLLIVAGAWSAVMQARKQIGDLAKVQVISAIIGIVVSAPLVWFFGAIGAATSIVVVAGLPSLVIYLMRRSPASCGPASDDGARKLLRLGVAMLGIIAVTQLSLYATRILIVSYAGMEHSGFYQAALTTAGSIPNFIFVAMGVDYFPRVAAARDEDEILGLTNGQIQAGIMMALPLFAGLILFGRQLLTLLYSDDFTPAEDVQGWMIWGVACRLVTWPIGYWLMAKASAKEIFVIEGAGAAMAPLLTLALLPQFGFSAVGIAYFSQAVLYGALVLWFMYHKTGRVISPVSAAAAVVALAVLGVAQWQVLGGATTAARLALFAFVGVVTLAAYFKVSMDKSND
jgi:PST family polysaccharide transporter